MISDLIEASCFHKKSGYLRTEKRADSSVYFARNSPSERQWH